MFHQTKIKLTAWYLLIIMVISGMFSVAIYRLLTVEIDRFAYQQQIRYERVEIDWRIPEGLKQQLLERLDPELVSDAKKRIAQRLFFINGGILLAASAASYFLAGRTLRPIQEMVDEQKRFIADASHEFKTPLTSLRSEIEVGLRDKALSLNTSRELLGSNLEEVIRLQELTDRLLILAKNGNYSFADYSTFELDSSMKYALKHLSGLIKKKNVKIVTNFERVKFNGAYDRITEAFIIFVDNAIKYSKNGGTIQLSISKKLNFAVITIKDYGIGIANKDIPHIFERFFRSDNSRSKNKVSGFGLGLSIADKIIKAHKGTISLVSELDKGTEFKIKLPLNKN